MNNTKKDHIGLEIHQRLQASISHEKRKKKAVRSSLQMLMGLFLLAGAFWIGYEQQWFSSLHRPDNQEYIADLQTRTFSKNSGIFSGNSTGSVDSSGNQAIYQDKDKNLTVLNISKLSLANNDILTIKTGVGGFYKVELPDGSLVNLNAKSSLKYQANYLKDRQLTLSGEAYFEVQPLSHGKTRVPFAVNTDRQTIEVLGTQFNVKTGTTYDETLLFEGRLDVHDKQGSIQKLFPGDLVQVNEKETNLKKLQSGEIEEFLAWKDGFLYYNNRSLFHILADLQKYYDFEFDKAEVPDERFTIYLAREKELSELLDLLSKSSSLHLQLANNNLQIKK